MANEMAILVRLDVTQGFFTDSINKSFTDNFPIIGLGGGIQVIGTTEEVIDFDDITYEGWLYLENLDPSNVIEYGPESGGVMVPFGKILPGKGTLLMLKPGTVVRARAWNAASRLLVKLYDTATST